MISIVIVNWNSGSFLQKCVDSLLEHAGGCEIIVVDNASEDRSLGFLATRPDIVLLRNRNNAGFAAACNAGWRRARGDVVLFLNPDTEVLSGSISRLIEPLQRDAGVWAAGGMLSGPSGGPQENFNVRRLPNVASVAAETLFLDEVWPGNRWTGRYRLAELGSLVEVEQPAAACLMVRRSALECIGGFDESFAPAWFDDVDLCERIRKRGGRIVFQPIARFLHRGGFSVELLGYPDFLKHYRTNQIRYFAKHHGPEAARRVRRLIVTGMFLRSFVSIVIPLAGRSSRLASAKTFWRAGCYFAFGRDVAP